MPETRQTRVNIRSIVNKAGVRKDMRNGRAVMVAPSATLPDNCVMNNIMYPADEIAKSFASLNRTPAPLGHPMLNGQFVSASDPEGMNLGYIGAWNENVRQVGGRVLLDKIIDVEVANRTEGGRNVLAALEKGEPVHTSTGLLCRMESVTNGDGYSAIARDMLFDHDAILLNEEGAATPAQGVGMLVNGVQIPVINSTCDMAEQNLDWAGMNLLDALDRVQKASVWDKLKAAIMGVIAPAAADSAQNRKDDDMTANAELEALSAKVNTLSDGLDKLIKDMPGMITNAVKPMVDNLTEIQNAAKAAAEAEKADLVGKVVKANVLTDAVAKELTVNALKELVAKIPVVAQAAALNGAFVPATNGSDFAAYDPNAAIADAMKEGK